MKKIGVKLADGSFYPLLEEGVPGKKKIDLSTVKDNQTTVKVDLYASEKSTMADAILIDSLMLEGLEKQPNGQPDISLSVSIDKKDAIEAVLSDSQSKAKTKKSINLHEVLLAADKNPGTGKGLLAAAQEINEREDSEEKRLADELDDFSVSLAGEGAAPQAEVVPEEEKKPKKLVAETKSFAAEETLSDDSLSEESILPEPDFSSDENSFDDAAPEEPLDQSLDLPDFDVPDFSEKSAQVESDSGFGDSSFDLPDFSSESDSLGDSLDDSSYKSQASSSAESSMDFSDLYDEEEDEREERRSRLPVLLCVICAIICVLALLLLLFLIPAKVKSSSSKTEIAQTQVQTQSAPLAPPAKKEEPLPPPPPPKPEPVPEPAAPAKEEEIVVIEQAEMVIPDLPKVEEKRQPKVITYKVKWGDTLWDIADAYYKNPWRYPKIAQYNGIKNPNHIVAGTYIKIPEE